MICNDHSRGSFWFLLLGITHISSSRMASHLFWKQDTAGRRMLILGEERPVSTEWSKICSLTCWVLVREKTIQEKTENMKLYSSSPSSQLLTEKFRHQRLRKNIWHWKIRYLHHAELPKIIYIIGKKKSY